MEANCKINAIMIIIAMYMYTIILAKCRFDS